MADKNWQVAVGSSGKLILAILAVVAITVLLMTHSIAESGGVGLLGLIVGYIVGNGVTAAGGKPVASILEARPTDVDGSPRP